MARHEDRAEADRLEADRVALERADAGPPVLGVLAPAYVRAVHPDHGEPVVFVPGERLPGWAAAAVSGRQVDDHGVIDLTGQA